MRSCATMASSSARPILSARWISCCSWGPACAGLLGFNLLSYERLTHEQHALEAQFTRVGEQQFDALLTYPSGVTQRYALRGDEWQIDARLLKWRGITNVLGFDSAYRLERI